MEQCIKCQQECQQEWYIPTSYGYIHPFCSEECANSHADNLVGQGGYLRRKGDPNHPNELIIDTGTNES